MNSKEITLFGFWASSATWRIRAALHYKQLAFNEISIDIVKKDRGWVDYQTKINPMGLVPAIKLPESGERVFSESLPILELLEETYPDAPKLMPTCSIDKHRMRQICEIINAGMQPLQNLSTLRVSRSFYILLNPLFMSCFKNKTDFLRRFFLNFITD